MARDLDIVPHQPMDARPPGVAAAKGLVAFRSAMFALMLGAIPLSACVNTRVFTESELAEVGRGCGLAPGEVMQEPDFPRYLFLYAIAPSTEQFGCVRRWARRHNMHLAYIEGVDFETNAEAD